MGTAHAPAAFALVSSLACKELATASCCMGCHALDKMLVDPSYQDKAKTLGQGILDGAKQASAQTKRPRLR